MTYAQVTDIERELGRSATSSTESEQWGAWLARIERAIKRRFTSVGLDLDHQVTIDKPAERDVVDAEVAAAIRKIQNPIWGLTSTTRSLDDGSITARREGGNLDTDPLELTDAEWAALLPRIRRARAFSVMPS